MTKRAPPAGRKRVWLVLRDGSKPWVAYPDQAVARGVVKQFQQGSEYRWSICPAELTWTEPPKRRPR